MAKGPGGFITGGDDPLNAPDLPTAATGAGGLGSATVSVTAPENTGGSAVSEYRFQVVDTSDDSDQSETSTTTSKELTLSAGTYKVRAVAFNDSGSSQPSEYSSNFSVFTGMEPYGAGRNIYGTLGTAASSLPDFSAARSSPIQVGALSGENIVKLNCQTDSIVAVTASGKMYRTSRQWGSASYIDPAGWDQLGSLTNWSTQSAGQFANVTTKTDGTIWAEGNNGNGQLGNNADFPNTSSPTQIGSDTDWANGPNKAVSGYATTYAIKTDGSLYAWGAGTLGSIGDNDNVSRSSPVQVGSDTDWDSIVGVTGYSVFVKKTDGTVYGWGYNNNGELGLDNRVAYSSPVQIGFLTDVQKMARAPFTDGVDNRLTLFIKADGSLWGMGDTQYFGELDQTKTPRSSPVQIGALTNWKDVGYNYSVAAVKTDGTLWSWGSNGYGQLGLNDRVNRSSPIQIGSDTDWQQLPDNQPRQNLVYSKYQ